MSDEVPDASSPEVPDAASRLYAQIVDNLRRGQLDEALRDALRLFEIEPSPELSFGMLALVHLQRGDFAKAATLLEESIAKWGEAGSALTNLSKAYHALGKHEEALNLARRGLSLDPNQNAGLIWYASLRVERDGPAILPILFQEIAELPGSWRSLLWQARNELAAGRLAPAVRLYQRALSIGHDSDALLMISGDLGKYGAPDQAIRLVAGRYRPALHDPNVGANLLQAYLSEGRKREGETLLAAMKDMPEISWQGYFQAFAKLAE